MKDLKGSNAILTGASRGLGVHIARALAQEGVNLALAARSAEGLESVKAELASTGVNIITVPTDVSDDEQLKVLVDGAQAELGPIDILVNNAGIEAMYRFQDYPIEAIHKLIDVNLTSAMVLTRLVLGPMIERGRGHIVQLASLAGKAGVPNQGPYAASKAGMIGFAQSLRAELDDSAVGSSVVCPGFVGEAGMYEDMANATGVRGSKLLGESKPPAVAAAVLKAIKEDVAQVIVNPSPMRPLIALGELFPGLNAPLMRVLGVTKLTRESAEKLAERADETPKG